MSKKPELIPEPTPEEASKLLQAYIYLTLWEWKAPIWFVLKYCYMYVLHDGNIEVITINPESTR